MLYYDVATIEQRMEERAQFSTHWIDQHSVTFFETSETASVAADSFIETPIVGAQTIPAAFWNALADFSAGRVVDVQTALNQPPPGV